MAGTVYIFGAGASRSATSHQKVPLPLATEFFERKYTNRYWRQPWVLGTFRQSALFAILRQYFGLPHLKRPISLAGVNVEEAYSFLFDFRSVYSSRTSRPHVLESGRRELLEFIVDTIRECTPDDQKQSIYVRVAEHLKPRDSIISFNWDVLADRALQTSAIGQEMLSTLAELADPPVPSGAAADDDAHDRFHRSVFLKLHGGVNLTGCSNPVCRRHASPFVWSNEDGDLWDCPECGATTEILLVPPHVHKTYSASRFLSLQASIAAQKLGIAEEIVVIGYSFPLFDFEARTMMRCARLDPFQEAFERLDFETFLRRVVLVNPQVSNPEYRRIARDLFGIDVRRAHGHRVELVTYRSVDAYVRSELGSIKAPTTQNSRLTHP